MYAGKWDLGAHALSRENNSWQLPVYGRSRPKHAVSVGLLALAEDERPDATLLIRFDLVCMRTSYQFNIMRCACQNLRSESIGLSPIQSLEAMPNTQIKARHSNLKSYENILQ